MQITSLNTQARMYPQFGDGGTVVWTLPVFDGTAPTYTQSLGFGDLTTLFVEYVSDLRDANTAQHDSDTLIHNDRATVQASVSNHDANTMYEQYLISVAD